MQSSGASLFAYCMAQSPECLAVIDLHVLHESPRFDFSGDIVMKCGINTHVPFMAQCMLFKPDVRLLFTRDLKEVRHSLSSKYYRDQAGTMDEKLALAARIDPADYDVVIDYRDFIHDRKGTIEKLGDLAGDDFYGCKRSQMDMLAFNNLHSEWLKENLDKKYGFGNMRLPFEIDVY